jgi:hypothetical protein
VQGKSNGTAVVRTINAAHIVTARADEVAQAVGDMLRPGINTGLPPHRRTPPAPVGKDG